MKRTTTAILSAILALAFAATVATAQDTNFAVRISCDFQQQAGAAELPDLTLLQGSAPMIQAVPMRMGRAVSAEMRRCLQNLDHPQDSLGSNLA